MEDDAPEQPAPPVKRSRARRVIGRIAKVLAWTVASVVVLLLLVFVFLQTGWGKSLVKGIVLDVLADTFRGRIEVDELGGFLPFDARLTGVRVYDPEGKEVMRIAEVTADFHPFELFDSTIHLSDVRVKEPTVEVFDEQQRIALLRAFEPRVPTVDDTPLPWVVRFEGVQLDDGRIDNVLAGEDLSLVDVQLDLSLGLKPTGLYWPNVELHARPVGTSELVTTLGGGDPSRPGSIVVKTRGGLAADQLMIDAFEVLAGEHAVAMKGQVRLGQPMVADVSILDLKVALDRLPVALRTQVLGPDAGAMTLAPTEAQGRGHLGITPDGEAFVELQLSTPYGLALVQGGATVRTADDPRLRLLDWSALIDLADLEAPPALKGRMPPAARGARADLRVEAFGFGSPLADDGRLRLEATIDEHAPNQGGLTLIVTRAAGGSLERVKTFLVEVVAGGLDVQPWAGIAGEPGLAGEIAVLVLDGVLSLPDSGLPEVSIATSFDARVAGRVAALGKDLRAPTLAGAATLQYAGSGLPSGRVDLAGVDLGFDLGGVRSLGLSFEVRGGADGSAEVEGTVRAAELRWDDISIASLEVPLRVVIEGLGPGGKLTPTGRVSWRATGVKTAQQTLASTSGELLASSERGGLRVRGVVRAGRLGLGSGLGVGGGDLDLDAWLGPGEDGAPVGGPITARVSGTVTHVEQRVVTATVDAQGKKDTAVVVRRVGQVALDDLRVAMPRGPGGPIEIDGPIRLVGVEAPEAKVERTRVDVDVTFDPARGEPLGTAKVEANGMEVRSRSATQRFDLATVDVVAKPRGRLELNGLVRRNPSTHPGEANVEVRDEGIEARFTGTATLPGAGRALAIDVDELRVRRSSGKEDLLAGQRLRFADGVLSVESLALSAGREAGALSVKGRFVVATGAVQADVVGSDVSIAQWLRLAADLMRTAGLPPPELPEALGGELDLTLHFGGSLAAPDLQADLDLADLRWGERRGAGAHGRVRVDGRAVSALFAIHWHDGGDLSLELALPAHLSLSPLALAWRDDEQVRIALSVDESDLSETFAWVDALSHAAGTPNAQELRQAAGVETIDGQLRLDLLVEGTPVDPRMRLVFVGHPLDIGRWKDGTLLFEGSAGGDESLFRMQLVDRQDRLQAMLDARLPFGIARAIRQPEPLAWLRRQLDTDEFSVELALPRFVIADTPLVVIAPDSIADLAAEVDLSLGGTLGDPVIEGSIDLNSPDASPIDLGFAVDIGTHEGVVEAYFSASKPGGDTVVDGSLAIPKLGDVLRDPASAALILNKPDLRLDLQTADIASFDFWEVNQSLGDLAVQLFPDGRVMVDVAAHGSPQGLVANVNARIRTVAPDGVKAPAASDATIVRRNAADDVRVAVQAGPSEIAAQVVLVQDTRAATPSTLAITTSLKTGVKAIMGGGIDFGAVPIEGRIVAGEFRLEGFASAFREVLGTSGGQLTGDVGISGTVLSPRFERSLAAQFQPIVVAPIGLRYDWVTVNIDFQNGTDWAVTVSELYDETRTIRSDANVARCGVTPQAAPIDFSKRPFATIQINGSIPTLDPKRMTLGGCIGLREYPILDKSDMRGQIDGELTLGGTVARPAVKGKVTTVEAVIAPKLAQKTVRPIGNPVDVTIVRGAPVPPPQRPEKNPYKIGMDLEIEAVIPAGSVRLEPSLQQLYGEVRAVLWPNGTLKIRTDGGELGLEGTILVPKETVFLYGREFRVDKDSRAVFTGDMVSDPQLYFTARYNIAHVDLTSIGLTTTTESEVVVRVTGTPTAPRLQFSSTPAMDETNILSVIALGVPAGGGGAVGDALQTQLITAVMGMATLQFARDFQQRLALDVLRIEARSADPRESRIVAGKRLAEDLILNYYLDLAADEDEDTNSGTLEYRFTRYLSILGRGGDSGDFGLELNLRFQE